MNERRARLLRHTRSLPFHQSVLVGLAGRLAVVFAAHLAAALRFGVPSRKLSFLLLSQLDLACRSAFLCHLTINPRRIELSASFTHTMLASRSLVGQTCQRLASRTAVYRPSPVSRFQVCRPSCAWIPARGASEHWFYNDFVILTQPPAIAIWI